MADVASLDAKLDRVLGALTVKGSKGPDDTVEKLYGHAKQADSRAAEALLELDGLKRQLTVLSGQVDELPAVDVAALARALTVALGPDLVAELAGAITQGLAPAVAGQVADEVHRRLAG